MQNLNLLTKEEIETLQTAAQTAITTTVGILTTAGLRLHSHLSAALAWKNFETIDFYKKFFSNPTKGE